MKISLTLFLTFFVVVSFGQLVADNTTPFSIGETVHFQSQVLGEERVLNVYLPLSYSGDSLQNYPVIYLLDGSADEDFIHVSGLVQFGSYSWINMVPESLVVGISNVDRKRDFTFPTSIAQDKADFPTTGGSATFINCLSNEIIPLIEGKYRTTTEKSLIGQSLGGLLATEILYEHTSLFDHYLIISPSLWWDNQSLLSKTTPTLSAEQSVFVAVGAEGKIMKRDAKELAKKLSGLKTNKSRVYFEYFPEQDHGDVLHLALYEGFESLFMKTEE